jgi:hypothetical protein
MPAFPIDLKFMCFDSFSLYVLYSDRAVTQAFTYSV